MTRQGLSCNPTPQLTIVKWFNKRRAVGTHHTGTTTGFLSSLWSPVIPQQSWHLAVSSVVFSPRWPKPKLFHSIHAGGYSAYLSHRRFNAQCSHERTPEFLSALQPTSSESSWIHGANRCIPWHPFIFQSFQRFLGV